MKTVRPALAAIAATCLIGLGSSAAGGDPGLELGWDIVSRRPHDATAFTQGLELDASGRMFESTGLRGRSTLREVDPWSGEVLRAVALPDEYFGEGLTLLGDRLVQLTWRAGVAQSRDVASLQVVETYAYDGEGWGLCFDGERLVMSDGSDQLTFRDPATFEITGSIEVTLEGAPQGRLNELECAGGVVWANIWRSDVIVRIDPDDGRITGVLDLAEVLVPSPALSDPTAVLNGIAYDAEADTFLVTGKLWPELIEIKVQGPLPSG